MRAPNATVLLFACFGLTGCSFHVVGLSGNASGNATKDGGGDLAGPRGTPTGDLGKSPPAVDLGAGDSMGGPGAGDLSVGGPGAADLSAGGPVDMASPTGCSSATARVCTDNGHSAHCDLDSVTGQRTPTIDRTCPPGSTCANGYCQVPPGAASCAMQSDCGGGTVCDQFVVGGGFKGACAMPLGSNVDMPCGPMLGNDVACKTGLCVASQDGAKTQCLFPCSQDTDCPPMLKHCQAVGAPMSIEGVSIGSLQACFH